MARSQRGMSDAAKAHVTRDYLARTMSMARASLITSTARHTAQRRFALTQAAHL